MKQVGARHDIIREWRSLPKELRRTDEQAEAFAMQIKDKYRFSSDRANQYQTIRGWLLSYQVLTRGRGVNAKGKAEMIDNRITDPGFSATERKTLRNHEAQEATADQAAMQKAFHEKRERLREERLRREAAAGPMFYPASELPDDTHILNVRFSTRIRKALNAEGMKTIGEIREASDAKLLSLPNFGKESVAYLRQALGLSSAAGLSTKITSAT